MQGRLMRSLWIGFLKFFTYAFVLYSLTLADSSSMRFRGPIIIPELTARIDLLMEWNGMECNGM